VAGIIVALIIHRRFRGESIFKVILTLPLAIPPVAIGSMWKLLVYPAIGPLPYYLSKIGISWDITKSATNSFATTVIMDTWHWLPFSVLIILAGLTGIPKEILESAAVDGASGLRRLWYIIFPSIKFELMLVVLFRGMDAFRIFDEIWMLTGGGPGNTTRYLSVSLYMLVLKGWDIGLGSAFSALFLYIIIVLSWILYKIIIRVK
jgi:multiple sugar transport system permease protein